MIWVTWRQFRTTILAAVGGILALTVVALISGLIVRNSHTASPFGSLFGCSLSDDPAACWAASSLTLVTLVTVMLPVLLGVLVGATVFSRDIERGSHVLGLTQDVSRTRWYWMRVLVVFGPVTVAMVILGSVLEWSRTPSESSNLTYSPSRFASGHSRLTFPLFQSSGLTAGAYTLLALILGSCVALLLRNTLGAMAVTVIAISAVLVGFQLGARPHYATASVERQEVGHSAIYTAYQRPDDRWTAWDLSWGPVDAGGAAVRIDYDRCNPSYDYGVDDDQRPDETRAEYDARMEPVWTAQDRAYTDCLRAQGADHYETRYHPDSLFRRFQLTEAALALALSALLLIPSMWALRRLRP
ncbi:ABC transporter permease [Prescottella agglutinans]|uniref:ABC-type transport system involved in multi-copper enzyme maturation permease subunit n=1 Tax=Prescottella agglutinans TaxID=1644129 RepID=A0ABT6MK59_9NOCA|nr:ABC transporter permease [Prescottella agglutinans]MDH6283734.1 ABC-type transport system involved in multi-copper enzyme maturation permease subunit [Prescottella agglutinans]